MLVIVLGPWAVGTLLRRYDTMREAWLLHKELMALMDTFNAAAIDPAKPVAAELKRITQIMVREGDAGDWAEGARCLAGMRMYKGRRRVR